MADETASVSPPEDALPSAALISGNNGAGSVSGSSCPSGSDIAVLPAGLTPLPLPVVRSEEATSCGRGVGRTAGATGEVELGGIRTELFVFPFLAPEPGFCVSTLTPEASVTEDVNARAGDGDALDTEDVGDVHFAQA